LNKNAVKDVEGTSGLIDRTMSEFARSDKEPQNYRWDSQPSGQHLNPGPPN